MTITTGLINHKSRKFIQYSKSFKFIPRKIFRPFIFYTRYKTKSRKKVCSPWGYMFQKLWQSSHYNWKIVSKEKDLIIYFVDSPIHLTETCGQPQKCDTTTVCLGPNTLADGVCVVLAWLIIIKQLAPAVVFCITSPKLLSLDFKKGSPAMLQNCPAVQFFRLDWKYFNKS